MDRTLRLHRETLTELSTDELGLVLGAGDPQPTPPVYILTHDCPTGTAKVTDCCPTGTCY